MFVEERQKKIIEMLRESGKVSVESLAQLFAVSAPTVRADLTYLDQKGMLTRTHGGAILKDTRFENYTGNREESCADEKRWIAAVAASRVRDGETVLLDSGTTVHEIARILRERHCLIVVTNSIPAAESLAGAPGIAVILIGGDLYGDRRATFGPLAIEFLKDIHVDHAFIGVNGVSEDAGYTVADFDAVQLKRTMMAHAREVIVTADHSKIGEAKFASIGALSCAQALVTDIPIENAALKHALDLAGVEVIQSPPEVQQV